MKKHLLILAALSFCISAGTTYAAENNAAPLVSESIELNISAKLDTASSSEADKTEEDKIIADILPEPTVSSEVIKETEIPEKDDIYNNAVFATREELLTQELANAAFDEQTASLFSVDTDGVLNRELPSMPTERAKFQSVSIGNKIYAIGGINSTGIVTTIDEFDYHAGTWRTITNIPYAIRGFAVAADGNKIYISGGFANGNFLSSAYTYDISADKWTEIACMHEPRENHSMVYMDGLIYAIGGHNISGTLDDMEYYNFADNTWRKASLRMNNARMDFAAAAKGHKIYIMGGFNDEKGYIKDCEIYSRQTGTWSELPEFNMSDFVFSQPTAVVYGDDIHVFWYMPKGSPYIRHSIYHTTTQKWDSKIVNTLISLRYAQPAALDDGICLMGGYADNYIDTVNLGEYVSDVTFLECDYIPPQDILLETGTAKSKAVYVNGTAYIVGGRRQGVNTSYIYRYDKKSNRWITATSMPEARRGFAAAVIGNKIYIIGGYCNGRFLDTVIAYDVVNKTWETCARMPKAREKASAAAVGGKIYVIGGRYESELQGDVFVYDSDLNTWKINIGDNILGLDLNLEAVDETIYVMGGYNKNNSPNLYICKYDGRYYHHISYLPDDMIYCRTAIHGNNILIAYQTSYDGSSNIQFKEYSIADNKLINTDIDFQIPSIWYELCKCENEVWVIGGYNGASYSSEVRRLYAAGVEITDSSMSLTGTTGKSYSVHFYASGIKDFSGKTFVIKYDPLKIEPEDLCMFTPAADINTSGRIINTDIIVKSFNPNDGLIKFILNKATPLNQTCWYGDITVIKFKMLQNNGSIRFYIE